MSLNQEYAQVQANGSPYDDLIRASAKQYGVSYPLLHKQLFMESRFNPDAQSPTGPRGIAQFTKATGAAYGLITDADFHNPAKSIDAAARHMRDNVRMAGGDELKALLLYNQGAGPAGRPQVEAYDRGDFGSISQEGLKYMAQMADVAKSDRSQALADLAKPEDGTEASIDSTGSASLDLPSYLQPPVKAQPEQPLSPDVSLKGASDDPAVQTPLSKLIEESEGPGTFEGLGDATKATLENSTIGTLLRTAMQDNGDHDISPFYQRLHDTFNDPFTGGTLADWTEADYAKIQAAGLSPSFMDIPLRGQRKDLDANIQIALESQKNEGRIQQAGFGAQLVSGAVGMIGDPMTYIVPGVGAEASLGVRMLGGAVTGGAAGLASEGLNAGITGRQADYTSAILGGAAFGAAAHGVLGRAPVQEAARGLQAARQAPVEGGDDSGLLNRLLRRERARQQGSEVDPTDLPHTGEETHTDGPVPFTDVPFEEGAVRTPDGSIHSAGSIINPRTVRDFSNLDPFNDKANAGATDLIGGLNEIGYTMASSENPEVRSLGYDLFRSTTGYQDGSNGKFGVTASDLHDRFGWLDKAAYRDFHGHIRDALNEPFWQQQDLSRAGRVSAISRRVAEAIEGGTREGLTAPERALADRLHAHLREKYDRITNPAQFGRADARPLLEGSRHTDSYFPQRYSKTAKDLMIDRLGRDGLQDAIANSMMESYHARPEVRARVDALHENDVLERLTTPDGTGNVDDLAEERAYRDFAEAYARRKAYGISHSDQFNRPSVFEDHVDGLRGIEANNYLEARNLFDSDVPTTLPDGSTFSLNDLREFDILRVIPAYDRRTNGDVAIMASTGRTVGELRDQIEEMAAKHEPGSKEHKEIGLLGDSLKLFTGRARRNPDGQIGSWIRTANNMAFFAKNAYMGIQNFTEAARVIWNGHTKLLLKNVPILKRWSTKGTDLHPDDLNAMHDMLFGREIDEIIRPSRADIVDRLRAQGVGDRAANVAGTLEFATGELASRSPLTWVLRETSNLIADAGRQGIIMDIAHQVLNGRESRLLRPERLRAASITPEQFADISDLISSHFARDASGKWRLRNREGFAKDPRSTHLWRLGDRVADEAILRPHKVSSQASKVYHPLIGSVMQFKMFMVRTLNGRMMRSYWEAKRNGAALDEAMSLLIGVGLSTAFYYATAHTKALGLEPRAREKYLKDALSPAMVAYQGVSRSSILGAPLGVANLLGGVAGFDWANYARTSVLPRDPVDRRNADRPSFGRPTHSIWAQDFASNVLDQWPAAGVAFGIANGARSAYHVARGKRGDDIQGHKTALFQALRNLVPNDPLTQNLLTRAAMDAGTNRTR
ncbi:transglycosylase SLT domain-containing protein [Pseudomonas sp. B14(2017)]|uniref:transglycosylase SLT domain-containing protein n=1 Tax=Pseudomonas sp. B14(2017) TaxID=1981745 RepID=UPI000A1DFFA9|nr:transglycosylase SLT domain-containing protein [Pseudomonas sp. B14(2017)]